MASLTSGQDSGAGNAECFANMSLREVELLKVFSQLAPVDQEAIATFANRLKKRAEYSRQSSAPGLSSGLTK